MSPASEFRLRLERPWRVLLVLAWFIASSAWAAPLDPRDVPAPLAPWVDWVLRGHEPERCPNLHRLAERRCAWPSHLEIDGSARGASFSQAWLVQIPTSVPLPGDEHLWPQDVLVDGKPAAVIGRGSKARSEPPAPGPSVRLEAGRHQISGRLLWSAVPPMLPIPPETGLLRLRMDGQEVAFPVRDAQGRLWLKRLDEESPEESRLEVSVHRHVSDEIPLELTTQVDLRVSGPSREVLLGRALPEGFAPLELDSEIPARIEPDGRLRVQLRAGSFALRLRARHEGPAAELSLPQPDGPWDDEEVWVFDARPALRLVSIEGVPAVDPEQTTLPGEWKGLPAYRMRPGEPMRLVEKRRGDSDPAPDQLSLTRAWWLDFDGGGYTIQDHISGEVRRSSRLDVAPPTTLGRVAIGGRPQLITRPDQAELAGIEIPRGPIEIEADSRLDGALRVLPAVSFDHDFDGLAATLQLPPGWRLVHASGVDDVETSWIGSWTLLDLFFVLVITAAALRLFGRPAGALALVTLALSWTELAAPHWAWIHVLVAEALARALRGGRALAVVRGYRLVARVALVLLAIPFLVDQVRTGLYPALRPPAWMGVLESPMALEERPAADQVMTLESMQAAPSMPRELERAKKAFSRPDQRIEAIDPTARVQTGPGLPTWKWTKVALRWRGPVKRDQAIGLWLLSPGVNTALGFGRAGLTSLLVLWLLGLPVASWLGKLARRGTGAAAGLLLASLALAPQGSLAADFPSQELLDELRARLLEAHECHPVCASSPRLRIGASPTRLVARFEVHAAAATAVPLPGSASQWSPESVVVDGKPAEALARTSDGTLWLALDAGAHQIGLEGRLAERDVVQIALPLVPSFVEASVVGWTLAGLHPDGRPEGALQLSRIRTASEPRPGGALAAGSLPSFVRVEREISLGLTWQVHTRVTRLSPLDAALRIELPILAGESVTSAGLEVRNGRVSISLPPQVAEASYDSALAIGGTLALAAPDSVPWIEIWRVDVGSVWHLEAEGIPPVHVEAAGARRREWRPWPGETLTLSVSRPPAVEAPTLTIDRSHLAVTPGLRATDVELELVLRSSQGGQHALTLPEGAELGAVAIDGRVQPIRQEGRQVTLPVVPGSRLVSLAWRQTGGISTRTSSPEVDLGAPSVNSQITLHMPEDRWTLLTSGPALGPAVLFWPLLLVVVVAAVGLGRAPLTPLRGLEWLLLGIGLTQVPVLFAALVPGWLFALAWRRRYGAALQPREFDLVQIALVLLTIASLVVLFEAIRNGLLGPPEMRIAGNDSTFRKLVWYQDRSASVLEQASAISLSIWAYRITMLAWALWIAFALIRWLRFGWGAFSEGGLWRRVPKRVVPPAAPPPARP